MNEPSQKVVLNAGSGPANAGRIHPAFISTGWKEVRLDIEPRAQPDIVASICDMKDRVADASFDALWSSHTIEHLHAHEVIPAFREFRRVVRNDGFALLTCPNLTAIARLAATGDVESVVYTSPAGPIRTLDMLYGLGRAIGAGHFAMAHNTGYTSKRLARVALEAGFSEVRVIEGTSYDLWAMLFAQEARAGEIGKMFAGTNVAGFFDEASAHRESGVAAPVAVAG